MLSGIALARSELPAELIERHGLQRRAYERGGEPEVQFLLRDEERVLPVWLEGQLVIARWGTRRGQGGGLPCTAWSRLATLEGGGWAGLGAVPVVIPATLGLDRGVWYRIREGVRGVAVRDERGRPTLYVLVEPATHYYAVMTRGSAWMPVLVGELI
jgi:hypothetical protein